MQKGNLWAASFHVSICVCSYFDSKHHLICFFVLNCGSPLPSFRSKQLKAERISPRAPRPEELAGFVAVPLIPCYTERGETTPWRALPRNERKLITDTAHIWLHVKPDEVSWLLIQDTRYLCQHSQLLSCYVISISYQRLVIAVSCIKANVKQ